MALPLFLSAHDRADAKSKVGELVGISKECATFNAKADMTTSTITGPIVSNVVNCGGSSPGTLTITSRSWMFSLDVQYIGSSLTSIAVKMVISPAGRIVSFVWFTSATVLRI